jgi:hypothetical protein
MVLTNVSPEQLAALQSNFENQVVIKPAEEKGRYDVSIKMDNEAAYWKLFYAGAEFGTKRLAHDLTSK